MGVVKLADYRPQLEVVEHRVADIQTVCLLVAVISWRSGTVGITSTERNLAITGANKCRFSNFRL